MADTIALSFRTFGELLKHLRQRARLTQDELGLAVGYSRAHLARLESNQRTPDLDAVRSRFIEALDLRNEPKLAARLIELAQDAHGDDHAEAEAPKHTPNNLPLQLSSFIGRTAELTELQGLLHTTRLLTLTGIGGTGKTRLALQLAGLVLDGYRDGVYLVELAPVADAGQVTRIVAVVLGIHEEQSRPILETLVDDLRDKQMLVLLDNCEHVIDACAELASALLRGASEVKVLATSREALAIAGELAWQVPSLSVPETQDTLNAGNMHRYEAVQLFLARAEFARAGFDLDAENAAAVQQICAQLDGIPLALELAAARVKAFSVNDIAARLNDRFRLLTGGSRTVLPRQQTLQAAIDWSYRLLTEPERILLRRLASFVSSWTLEAAESVCCGDGIEQDEVLDLLARLVDKSLVLAQDSGDVTRYRMLETIRQYALEKLADTDEVAHCRDRHLEYFIALGAGVEEKFSGFVPADHDALVKTLSPDIDNIRRALDWATETNRVNDGLCLGHAMWALFMVRVGQGEMLSRFGRLLVLPVALLNTRARALALVDAANTNLRQGEFDITASRLEQALAIGLALDDPIVQARVYEVLRWYAGLRGDFAQEREYMHTWRDILVTHHLMNPGLLQVALLSAEAGLALDERDYPTAQRLYEQVIPEFADTHLSISTTASNRFLGYAQLYQGNLTSAGQSFRKSLRGNRALGDKQAVAACVATLAMLALARVELTRAARLFGASEGISQSIHTPLMYSDVQEVKRNVAVLRERMDADLLAAEWSAGRAMTLEQAVAYALDDQSHE